MVIAKKIIMLSKKYFVSVKSNVQVLGLQNGGGFSGLSTNINEIFSIEYFDGK